MKNDPILRISHCSRQMLVHPMTPVGPIPTAQDPDGVYPYESYCETSRRPILKNLHFIIMENRFLRITVCPDLGGKVTSILLKNTQREVLWSYPVVRPSRILPRMAYIGGGIEVSFPISHTPSLIAKVCSHIEKEDNRCYVCCGEREIRFGMQWTVEFSLGRDDAFLTQRTTFYNPTDSSHPWMSWSNAGIPAYPDTEFHFPTGRVLAHNAEMKFIDWAKEGPRRQQDIGNMVGYFWQDAVEPHAFGAFSPCLGCGLYHIADPREVPGIKLWSDGIGPHEAWVSQGGLDLTQCLEIQAGPLVDQSIKAQLQPKQRHTHTEFWIPSEKKLDIRDIQLPQTVLRPVDQIPLFSWARNEEVEIWENLLAAYQSKRREAIPDPPGLTDNRWAPSGMCGLDKSLKWAAENASDEDHKDIWMFQAGAWFAGRDEIDEALKHLEASTDNRSHVLAARIYRRNKKDPSSAVACFQKVTSHTFALHPQVIFERDLALSAMGPQTLQERDQWLAKVAALKDEWIIERRAALLCDQGHYVAARELLQQNPFQLVHQRYARSRLWKRIKDNLGIHQDDPPNLFGEDNLFEFGAYREYQEESDVKQGR